MGTTKLLPNQKIVQLCILFVFLNVMGCSSKIVNYDDFVIKPYAVKSDDFIKIKQGSTTASSFWIKTKIRIEQDEIFLSGILTFLEQPIVLTIKLSDPMKKYRIFWVDENLRKTEIIVGDKNRITNFHVNGTIVEQGSNKPIKKAVLSFSYESGNLMEQRIIGSSGQDGHFDIKFEQWWGFGDPFYKGKSNETFKLIFSKEGYKDKSISYNLGILPEKNNDVKIDIDQLILTPK